MPKILPFNALIYSEKLRGDLGKLLSPPYDVISQEGFEKLKAGHNYQSVRLALVEDPKDAGRYSKMKDIFNAWKKEGALQLHEPKSFYLMEDTFESDGKKQKRVGFVALLEVSPFEKKEILPHEHTLSGPKVDRLELLKTMRAEISQIFLCYKDSNLVLERLYEKKSGLPALLEGTDSSKIHRKVWAVSDPSEVESLQNLVASRSALIADGHHRYETAVAFSAESKYVQVYLTNLNSPGFSIHPIHRLFSLPKSISLEYFLNSLRKSFDVSEWAGPLSVDALMAEKKNGDLKLFCAIKESKKNYLLSQKPANKTDAEIFSIHRNIFEKILGWNVTELAKGTIQYEHETPDFIARLNSLESGVGLFLPPTDLEVVMTLAERGERMPQKSTFFYPKLASGLINYDLGVGP